LRDEVRQKVLRMMPKGGVAAEIGVWKGLFSATILEETEPAELHLIDPWLYQPEHGNTMFGRSKNADLMEKMFEEVSTRFAADARVRIHRKMSEEALTGFPDNHFDWVYIDGNHNEPFVTRDLEMSRAKVKPGGTIAGDDLHWKGSGDYPVKTAVWKFLSDLGDSATYSRFGQQYVIRLAQDAQPID
jgi:hypothetical protein